MDALFNSIISARTFWLNNNIEQYEHIMLITRTDIVKSIMLLLSENECDKELLLVLSEFEIPMSPYYSILYISKEIAEGLITLYSMYEFTNRLVIASFDLPHGRKLQNLLDCRVATQEELIRDVILEGLLE